MTRFVFRNANVLDGANPAYVANVVVDDERITEVRRDGAVNLKHGDTIYDLAGRTLMPGLVAGHAHLAYHNLSYTDPDMRQPPPYWGVVAARNAETVLKAGFTSAVSAGTFHNCDVVLKQLMTEGLVLGPRLVASGKDFCITSFPLDYKPDWWGLTNPGYAAVCDGPEEFRKGVRQEAKRGVEIIKLFPEGGHGFPPNVPRMSAVEVMAAADAAHMCAIRIRAHVHSKQMLWTCIKAGIDIIDHADEMDEEIIDEIAKRGIYVLPSLYYLKASVGILNTQEECDRWFAHARNSLAKAISAGVKLVTGDDFGTMQAPHGQNARELMLYVNEIGIPPLEVIKWATVNGGEMTGRVDVGRIAAGMLADLLVVNGDPVRDMSILLADNGKLDIVMLGGKIITNRLSPAPILVDSSRAA